MEDCVRVYARKLALWQTRNFSPLIAHDDLELIMTTFGFVASSPYSNGGGGGGAQWKEYTYSGYWWRNEWPEKTTPPRLRLPYPRLDGHHISIYINFLDALNYYLQMPDISVLFHIRGMPLNRMLDRKVTWKRMEKEDDIFVYREGTLDQEMYNSYQKNKNENNINSNSSNRLSSWAFIGEKDAKDTPASCIVPLKDIIVRPQ